MLLTVYNLASFFLRIWLTDLSDTEFIYESATRAFDFQFRTFPVFPEQFIALFTPEVCHLAFLLIRDSPRTKTPRRVYLPGLMALIAREKFLMYFA